MWFQVWGANTNVGKTIISAGIISQLVKRAAPCLYLKPIQTGYPPDDDASFVLRHCKQLWKGDAAELDRRLMCKKLFVFEQPLSAEEAAKRQGRHVSDQQVLQAISEELKNCARQSSSSNVVVETAGGVLSPFPSGTSQADGYRPLRLPVVLVGDGALGGISTTMTCYESLLLRGYDVPIIVGVDQGYPNAEAWNKATMMNNQQENPLIVTLPLLPPKDIPLFSWYAMPQVEEAFQSIVKRLDAYFHERVKKWEEMEKTAPQLFWWPFTQHKSNLHPVIVDSAFGDNYRVAAQKKENSLAGDTCVFFHHENSTWYLWDAFDGVASWWTQGVGHANVELTKSMTKAAGRYGHVIFPQVIHQPAYELSKELIETVGYPWAKRAYYSDDGSTAIEIAIKMALRLYATRHGNSSKQPPQVLSFYGSYHGDTLGAMDCCPKGDFNELQSPWFEPKGVFIEAPRIGMQNKRWILDISSCKEWFPSDRHWKPDDYRWNSWEEIADGKRDDSTLGNVYREYANKVLDENNIATLIIEPLIQGAGGMRLIDPCFQRILVEEAKRRRIPVIFDEVFCGIWRLGVLSSTEVLHTYPDIAAYAKLLTGGLLPMAVTLTTEEVFDAFKADKKKFALLHGHSYTAYPVGCQVALESLAYYRKSPHWKGNEMSAFWNMDKVKELSALSNVDMVSCLGTVLAIQLKSPQQQPQGYHAVITQEFLNSLLAQGVYTRPLGNVVYLMCSPCTPTEVCDQLLDKLLDQLGQMRDRLLVTQDDVAIP